MSPAALSPSIPGTPGDALLFGAWLVLLVAVVTPTLRLAERRTRLVALALFAIGLLARLAVPGAPANWYTPLPEGDGYHFLLTTGRAIVPYGTLAPLLGAHAWFGVHRVLGALAPVLLFLAGTALVRPSVAPGRWAPARAVAAALPLVPALWALLLALHPLWVRLSASDALHVPALAFYASAALALVVRPVGVRGLPATALVALGVGLGLATRPELAPAFLALPLLSYALGGRLRFGFVGFVLGLALAAALALDLYALQAAVEGRLGLADGGRGLLRSAALDTLAALGAPDGLPRSLVAWAGVVALAVLSWRRALAAVVLVGLATTPAWLQGGMGQDLVTARYVTLGPVAELLPTALVAALLVLAARTYARVPRRRALAVVSALALVAGLGALAVQAAPAFTARYVFQDEYAFLEDALGRLPPECRVIALFVGHPGAGVAGSVDLDLALALPHPLLTASHPGIRFDVVASDGPPLRAPVADECVAVYEGALCALPDAASSEARAVAVGVPGLDAVCRALRTLGSGAVVAERVAPFVPGFRNRLFEPDGFPMRLVRVTGDVGGQAPVGP